MRRGAYLLSALCVHSGKAFIVSRRTGHMYKSRFSLHSSQTEEKSETVTATGDPSWMKEGFLFSSFSAGLLPNLSAHEALKQAIYRTQASYVEQRVRESALASPCCGPTDLTALDDLLDPQLESIRLVFIPTALYALRPESKNTPGKQRQRARADAKKRRRQIVQLLEKVLECTVQAVTLDVSDGSIAQADNETVTSETALSDWQPHVVYLSGGNTFWLHHCLDDDWTRRLQSCEAVYMGQSAGAIVAGQSVETACWKQWDDPRVVPHMENYDDWQSVKGLNLVGDYSLFPHMNAEWKELVKEKSGELKSELQTIQNDEVYQVKDKSLRLIDS